MLGSVSQRIALPQFCASFVYPISPILYWCSAGEGTDPQIVQELADVVGRGCSLCHDAMRVEGVKVLRLMSSDVTEFSRIKCIHKKGKMGNILQVSSACQDSPLSKDFKGIVYLMKIASTASWRAASPSNWAYLSEIAFGFPQCESCPSAAKCTPELIWYPACMVRRYTCFYWVLPHKLVIHHNLYQQTRSLLFVGLPPRWSVNLLQAENMQYMKGLITLVA